MEMELIRGSQKSDEYFNLLSRQSAALNGDKFLLDSEIDGESNRFSFVFKGISKSEL